MQIRWCVVQCGAVRSSTIDTIIFDFDATLTQPHAIDFAGIKRDIGCPDESTILDFISSLEDDAERTRASGILVEHERIAAETAQPGEGAEELVLSLRERGYRVGVLTRNSTESVHRSLQNFTRISADHFDTIVSRDDPVETKPHPESVRFTAELMGAAAERILVIGDHRHDIDAGREAGSWTCLLLHGSRPDWADAVAADYEVTSLNRIPDILHRHRPLPMGKLPNALLTELLTGIRSVKQRNDVIVHAAVGHDYAAVDVNGRPVVVAKSDPITFATNAPGRYAVMVNANDLACSGAEPHWFLCTALLPSGSTPYDIETIFAHVDETCLKLGVALIGGHTELTDAVRRPVLCGTMLGTATRAELVGARPPETLAGGVTPPLVQPGDRVLMTKTAAIEGSLILAASHGAVLTGCGVSQEALQEISGWEEKLSILSEAKIASRYHELRLLHDVTEGGVAGALRELAAAAAARITVTPARIPVASATQAVCRALGCSPLGLIGSGSLLIVIGASEAENLQRELRAAGIAVADIGEVVRPGSPEVSGGLPDFEVDELARYST